MKNNPFDIYTEEYEDWFKINDIIFQSELLALKQVIPVDKKGIEIGIGSGIFAEKLSIKYGIDPSENMLNYARKRNLIVDIGYAEDLPYTDCSFNFAVFITSICFIYNPKKALQEAYRIITDNGYLIIAFLDRDSLLGQTLIKKRQTNKFYQVANFYTVPEIISLIESSNFKVSEIYQTLTDLNINCIETPIKGYGKGSFIVIKAKK